MKSSIGECSRNIIEKLIAQCNSANELTIEEADFYHNFINNIGEEYLSFSLNEMLNEKIGKEFYDSKIALYIRKIAHLENLKNEDSKEDSDE